MSKSTEVPNNGCFWKLSLTLIICFLPKVFGNILFKERTNIVKSIKLVIKRIIVKKIIFENTNIRLPKITYPT